MEKKNFGSRRNFIRFALFLYRFDSMRSDGNETDALSLKKRTGRYERNLLYHRGKKDSDY